MIQISKFQLPNFHKLLGHFRYRRAGFTLPELLIVMTVIAGMAAIMMVAYPASQKRARDTRRLSDVKQYQTALELYANRTGSYTGLANGSLVSQCTALGIASCPNDPNTSTPYQIRVTGTSYTLWAQLEQPPTPINYFVVCSNGRSGKCTTVPTSAAWCDSPSFTSACQ